MPKPQTIATPMCSAERSSCHGAPHVLDRNEALARYRRYSKLRKNIQNATLTHVSPSRFLAHAKKIGLGDGKHLFTDDDAELTLVCDLAVYTAKAGQTRAIDRYARRHEASSGADEAVVLAGLRAARFSVFRVIGRSEIAGLVLDDLMRGGEIWLMDEGLERSARPGEVFAMRVAPVDLFAVTCGAVVPIDSATGSGLANLFDGGAADGDLAVLADDPRFAASIFQLAVALDLMGCVAYQ
ncbi:hypothetical protein [Enhydrobacter sp.]|jgi:hypothetical protein|uniref:hypothetical protein n=1 Tax=Enhydrobacter sp. TaxID=1894999 RepID=UPI0026234FDD|nr:hypothetical protein [Enhydrobacter sp.]WIM09523.1 MAG: hypothetical protein OJF58_000474 [Enhydrobacter sp.]